MICSKCGIDKLESDFYWRKENSKHRTSCKECDVKSKSDYYTRNVEAILAKKRAYHHKNRQAAIDRMRVHRYKRRYGITVEQFDALFELQGGCCKLCGKISESRRLCIDHDHITDAVRGLLCIQCNSALGKLGDTVEGLMRALAYVKGEL